MAKSRLRVSRTKAPPGLSPVQKRSRRRRSSSSVKKPMLEKRLRARSNSPENSMSRMSWRTSWRGSPTSAARSLARWSSVSDRSTPVTSKPRRARAREWRPKPHGASRIRPPAGGATWPRIQPASDSASTSDSRPREMIGHDSSKNRLSNTAALYRIRSSSDGGRRPRPSAQRGAEDVSDQAATGARARARARTYPDSARAAEARPPRT